jgi:ABC-type uncharacterized transport system ATPase subunit
MSSAAPAIELKGISKAFGPVQANKDISMSVAKGAIHGIVGENGAGKSTLMSILYGFYKADKGEIFINGQKPTSPTARPRSAPASAWCTSISNWWRISPSSKTSSSARKTGRCSTLPSPRRGKRSRN